jgi:hypothetical protein
MCHWCFVPRPPLQLIRAAIPLSEVTAAGVLGRTSCLPKATETPRDPSACMLVDRGPQLESQAHPYVGPKLTNSTHPIHPPHPSQLFHPYVRTSSYSNTIPHQAPMLPHGSPQGSGYPRGTKAPSSSATPVSVLNPAQMQELRDLPHHLGSFSHTYPSLSQASSGPSMQRPPPSATSFDEHSRTPTFDVPVAKKSRMEIEQVAISRGAIGG